MRRCFLMLLAACFAFAANAQTTIHSENFSTNTAGAWTPVSVLGPTHQWLFTSGYATINGFGSEDDEDWLISPAINMDVATGETFSFTTRNRYNGPMLELYYTTSYTGNPTDVGNNWQTIPLTLTANNTTTQPSGFTTHTDINVSAITGTAVRYAFKYYGTATVTKQWQIDDILLRGFTSCPTPTNVPSSPSVTTTVSSVNLSWTKGDGTNSLVLFSATDAFTDPTDGTTYTANTAYSGSTQQVVYTGSGNSVTVTGLTNNTAYYIRIYNFSACTTPIDYYIADWASIGATTQTSGGGGGGGEPTGYYDAANGLTCQTKRDALQAIITTGHIDRTYGGLWTAYATTDVRSGTNRIWDMYTDKTDGTYCSSCPLILNTDQDGGTGGATECDKYNREHTVPKSWFNDAAPMHNDAFHVVAADKKVNNVRGNDPYGEVASSSYTSCNGSKWGTSSGNGLSGNVFEPIDEYKGDFARIYFYMATRYGNVMRSWANNTTEANSIMVGTSGTFPIFNQFYLLMLIRWHQNDPVSAKETARNNAVYTYQGNRNPYVDHPEYVLQVWGCAIPVTLMEFKGVYDNSKVKLTWLAENEIHFSHYEIERQNTEGGNFERIATVKAAQLRTYNFDDDAEKLVGKTAYYRLKMVDNDGTYQLSKIVAVELPTNKKNVVTIYPNPANQSVTLDVDKAVSGSGKVEVIDILGKIWLTQNISFSVTQPNLDLGNLPNGSYFVQMTLNGATYRQRLQIAH